ncbi:MAG: YdcF family protein [Roseburia sp.]|nr:YdcF family protein [Roseburia sp.]
MEKIQYLCMGAGFVLLALFAAPLLTKGILNIGTVTGILLSGLLIFYGCFMGSIHEKIRAAAGTTVGKIVLAAVILLAAAILVTAVAETVLMVKAASNHPPKNTTAVVLGCKVKGTKPSRILQERLDAAYEYLVENEEAVAVLSGGQGPDEEISEAQCMFEYLTTKGIEENRLLLEDVSTTTRENLIFSKEILKEQGLGEKITIITSDFHAYRACDMAEKLGLESYSTPAHTFFVYLPTYYVRELYGILYYKIAHS